MAVTTKQLHYLGLDPPSERLELSHLVNHNKTVPVFRTTVGAESLCRCRRKARYLKRIHHGSKNTFKGSQDKFVQFLCRPFSWWKISFTETVLSLPEVPKVHTLPVHVFLKKKQDFIAMWKEKQFLTEDKSKIMCWGEIRIKSKEIAARLGRRERAVWIHLSVLKKLPPNASPPPPKARSGRPSKTSKAQDQRLKAYVEKYPFKSARQL